MSENQVSAAFLAEDLVREANLCLWETLAVVPAAQGLALLAQEEAVPMDACCFDSLRSPSPSSKEPFAAQAWSELVETDLTQGALAALAAAYSAWRSDSREAARLEEHRPVVELGQPSAHSWPAALVRPWEPWASVAAHKLASTAVGPHRRVQSRQAHASGEAQPRPH